MTDSQKYSEAQKNSFRIISENKIPPIVTIVGYSDSGKTTLLEKLISEFKQRGFAVGTIKHDVHDFEIDRPGKDTWRHKQAGASATIISSPNQIGMVKDVDHDHTPIELAELLTDMDIILAEGYKRSNLPKLEVFRSEIHEAPLCANDSNLLGLVCNDPIDSDTPRFSADNVQGITDMLIKRFNLKQRILTVTVCC